MAYSSSARSGASRGSSRGSSRESSRGPSRGSSRGGGGGSNNTVAYVVAIAIVGGAVGLVLALSGGDDKPKLQPSTTTVQATPAVGTPKAPPELAHEYPAMPPGKADEAKRLAASFDADAKRADDLYAQAQKARGAGNDEAWQNKLKEAVAIYGEINEQWNAFIATLPSNKWYDTEQVVAHYFPRENGRAAALTKKRGSLLKEEIR